MEFNCWQSAKQTFSADLSDFSFYNRPHSECIRPKAETTEKG